MDRLTHSQRIASYLVLAVVLTASVVIGCDSLNRQTCVTFENNTDDTLHDVVVMLPDGEKQLGDVEARSQRRMISDGTVDIRYRCTQPDGRLVHGHTEVDDCESLTWIHVRISATDTLVTYRRRTPIDLELKCQAIYDWLGQQVQQPIAINYDDNLISAR